MKSDAVHDFMTVDNSLCSMDNRDKCVGEKCKGEMQEFRGTRLVSGKASRMKVNHRKGNGVPERGNSEYEAPESLGAKGRSVRVKFNRHICTKSSRNSSEESV